MGHYRPTAEIHRTAISVPYYVVFLKMLFVLGSFGSSNLIIIADRLWL